MISTCDVYLLTGFAALGHTLGYLPSVLCFNDFIFELVLGNLYANYFTFQKQSVSCTCAFVAIAINFHFALPLPLLLWARMWALVDPDTLLLVVCYAASSLQAGSQ